MSCVLEIYQGHSISITLDNYERDTDTGEETTTPWEDGNYSFVIYSDPLHSKAAMTFDGETGLSVDGHVITVHAGKEANTLTPNDYFWSLHNDVDGAESVEEAQGTITVKASRILS
jgi:hypothetical protein